jgi:hypothetical protein
MKPGMLCADGHHAGPCGGLVSMHGTWYFLGLAF